MREARSWTEGVQKVNVPEKCVPQHSHLQNSDPNTTVTRVTVPDQDSLQRPANPDSSNHLFSSKMS
jgi:hypothetical protein